MTDAPSKSGNQPTILVVEDSKTQSLQLKLLLEEQKYEVVTAADGQEGLDCARRYSPDLILSDIEMPDMNGYEMCAAIKKSENLQDIPVILLTSLSDPEDIISGLNAHADSYVTKPYNNYFLLSKIRYMLSNPVVNRAERQENPIEFTFKDKVHRIDVPIERMLTLLLSTYEDSVMRNYELVKTQEALENLTAKLEEQVNQRTADLTDEVEQRKEAQEKLQGTVEKLEGAMKSIIIAMAATLEIRDPYTADHQRRVARLAVAIAQEMGLPENIVEGLSMACMIHDIGKMAIPLDVLNKPGPISSIEFSLIKTHPEVGFDILKPVEFPWPIAQIVYQHHERIDGSGYPRGLTDEEILPEALILMVADVVEAMASHRPYRPALGMEKALEEIADQKGKRYDPMVVNACLKVVNEKGFEFE